MADEKRTCSRKKSIPRRSFGLIANILAGTAAAAAVLAVVLMLCGNRFYIIRSGSMEPALKTGSVAFVNGHARFEEIAQGDIVCFTAANDMPVIHRAVTVSAEGIGTKGDANRTADSGIVHEENYVGKVVFHIPFIGYVIGFLSSVRGRILLVSALLAAVILWAFRKPSQRALAGLMIACLVVTGSLSGVTARAFDGNEIAAEEMSGGAEEYEETQEDPDDPAGTAEDLSEEAEEQDAEEEEGSGASEEDSPDVIPGETENTDPEDVAGTGEDPEEETGDPDEYTKETDAEDPDDAAENDDTKTEETAAPPDSGEETEAPESGETLEEAEEGEARAAAADLRAAAVYTATVRYRVNGGTIARDTSAATQYAVGKDIGKNTTLVYKSTDSGATWKVLTTQVTTEDTSADLVNVGTQNITMTGYRTVASAAYNTRSDQTGAALCQNGGTTNPVTTKRLNGGTEITSDVTIDIYVNWRTNLILDANGGAVWGDPSVTTVDAGTYYYGNTRYLINRTSENNPEIDSTYIQTIPNFYREGYVFDGWNTQRSGASYFGTVYGTETQYGRGGKAALKQLAGDGTGGTGVTKLYAQWIRRDGVSGTQTLSNGASLTNTDHFGKDSIRGIQLSIPYRTSESIAGDFSASSEASGFVWQMAGDYGHFYYMNAITSPTAAVSVPGTLNVRLNNRAYDNSGRRYDVSITLSNIVLNPQDAGSYGSYDAGSIYIFSYNQSTGAVSANVNGTKHSAASYDIGIRILEHGTETEVRGRKSMLYFEDLDSEDISTKPGKYRYVVNGSVMAPYTEAIAIPTSTATEFYTKSGENFVIARVEDGKTRITGGEHTRAQSADYGQITPEGNLAYDGIPMSDAEYTAVAFPVVSGNIDLSWSGSYCGTSLFASPATGNVQIIKQSADETVTDGNSSYSLAGAAFGLYTDSDSAQNAASAGRENGNEIAVLMTDETGVTPLSPDLTLGMYYIAELTAPAGYRRNTAVTEFEISTSEQLESITVSDRPFLDEIGILLQKTDEDGQVPAGDYAANLSHAQFLLEYYPKVTADLSVLEAGSPGRSWVYETDESGALVFSDETRKISGDPLYYDPDSENAAVPAGTLVLSETQAPAGFERDPGVYLLTIEFEPDGTAKRNLYDAEGNALDEDRVLSLSQNDVGLKIFEPLLQIDLILEKQIYKEDLLDEHGEISFAFEVSGTDLTGTDHTFCQLLRFAGAEEGTGTAERMVTITIPAGSYTIRELETDRYSLTDIIARTENLTVTKETAGSAVGTIQPVSGYASGTLVEDASVLFINRKTDWGSFSHTSSAVNHFGNTGEVFVK